MYRIMEVELKTFFLEVYGIQGVAGSDVPDTTVRVVLGLTLKEVVLRPFECCCCCCFVERLLSLESCV